MIKGCCDGDILQQIALEGRIRKLVKEKILELIIDNLEPITSKTKNFYNSVINVEYNGAFVKGLPLEKKIKKALRHLSFSSFRLILIRGDQGTGKTATADRLLKTKLKRQTTFSYVYNELSSEHENNIKMLFLTNNEWEKFEAAKKAVVYIDNYQNKFNFNDIVSFYNQYCTKKRITLLITYRNSEKTELAEEFVKENKGIIIIANTGMKKKQAKAALKTFRISDLSVRKAVLALNEKVLNIQIIKLISLIASDAIRIEKLISILKANKKKLESSKLIIDLADCFLEKESIEKDLYLIACILFGQQRFEVEDFKKIFTVDEKIAEIIFHQIKIKARDYDVNMIDPETYVANLMKMIDKIDTFNFFTKNNKYYYVHDLYVAASYELMRDGKAAVTLFRRTSSNNFKVFVVLLFMYLTNVMEGGRSGNIFLKNTYRKIGENAIEFIQSCNIDISKEFEYFSFINNYVYLLIKLNPTAYDLSKAYKAQKQIVDGLTQGQHNNWSIAIFKNMLAKVLLNQAVIYSNDALFDEAEIYLEESREAIDKIPQITDDDLAAKQARLEIYYYTTSLLKYKKARMMTINNENLLRDAQKAIKNSIIIESGKSFNDTKQELEKVINGIGDNTITSGLLPSYTLKLLIDSSLNKTPDEKAKQLVANINSFISKKRKSLDAHRVAEFYLSSSITHIADQEYQAAAQTLVAAIETVSSYKENTSFLAIINLAICFLFTRINETEQKEENFYLIWDVLKTLHTDNRPSEFTPTTINDEKQKYLKQAETLKVYFPDLDIVNREERLLFLLATF